MGVMRFLFSRSIPAYFWLGLAYAVFVGVIYTTDLATGGPETPVGAVEETVGEVIAAASGEDTQALNRRVDDALNAELMTLPLVSGADFIVTGTTIFIVLGFFCAWIEVVRATNIRDTAGNDTWSLIMTLISFVLFVGVAPFGTTAFLIVAIVGFGDVLLDRFVGQAVARRDFGGIGIPGGGGD